MEEIHGSEYLLDGYITLGHPDQLVMNGIQCSVQKYQGKHKNEYTLRTKSGYVYLYENKVLKQKWQENKNGEKSEEFIRYKNGRVDFHQRFEDILQRVNSNRIVYHKKGLRMEIWSAKTGHLLYHGECNSKRMKEGWGIEYDEESGNVVVEGIWNRGRLKEINTSRTHPIVSPSKNGSINCVPSQYSIALQILPLISTVFFLQ